MHEMALSHLAGSTLRTRNECNSSKLFLCSFNVLLLSTQCVRVRSSSLQIHYCEAYTFCRTRDCPLWYMLMYCTALCHVLRTCNKWKKKKEKRENVWRGQLIRRGQLNHSYMLLTQTPWMVSHHISYYVLLPRIGATTSYDLTTGAILLWIVIVLRPHIGSRIKYRS